MWVFLSSRIRTWIVVAIAVPLVRRVLQRLAAARAAKHPDSRSTAVLQGADSALGAVADRRSRKGRGRRADKP